MESEEDDEDDEDGQEEEGEISTYLKSKNPCFLDHCLSDLPKGNWRDRLISLRHEFLHLYVLRFDELLPPSGYDPPAENIHLLDWTPTNDMSWMKAVILNEGHVCSIGHERGGSHLVSIAIADCDKLKELPVIWATTTTGSDELLEIGLLEGSPYTSHFFEPSCPFDNE